MIDDRGLRRDPFRRKVDATLQKIGVGVEVGRHLLATPVTAEAAIQTWQIDPDPRAPRLVLVYHDSMTLC